MKRRAARALLWTVRCTLATAVPLGLSLLSQWFVLFVWREGYHDPVVFLILGCLPVYLGVPVLMFRYAKRYRADRIGNWRTGVWFVGAVVVFIGLFSGVVAGSTHGDQQILHDRGVTATGVITRADDVRGDSGSIDGVDTDVHLADGTTINVYADVDEHPRVGRTVQVTSDPRGRADAQLGPRPPVPGTLGEKVSLAILVTGHVMAASSIAGPLGEALNPRRLRRRRTTAGEMPSYGLEPAPEG
ncbi:hypothetical protein [Streptomyces sp. NPDC057403]|uniref:hypothetical protein n=1 Tax=Streptomyces sp. NPDC057403 TaxID=3346119 RepID=UPI0036B4B397